MYSLFHHELRGDTFPRAVLSGCTGDERHGVCRGVLWIPAAVVRGYLGSSERHPRPLLPPPDTATRGVAASAMQIRTGGGRCHGRAPPFLVSVLHSQGPQLCGKAPCSALLPVPPSSAWWRVSCLTTPGGLPPSNPRPSANLGKGYAPPSLCVRLPSHAIGNFFLLVMTPRVPRDTTPQGQSGFHKNSRGRIAR